MNSQQPPLLGLKSSGLSPIHSSTLTSNMTKESAANVKEDVERNFATHCRIADTTEVIDTLLPVEKTKVDKIYELLKGKHYVNKRWIGFPTTSSARKENDLYLPFVNVANAIHEAAQQVASLNDALDHDSTSWVDYHSKVPKSHDSDAAQIRPDCLFALSQVKTYVDKMEAQEDKPEEAKSSLKSALWWLQIVAIVEMKRSSSDSWEDVVKQLIGYLRRVLREQLDRRFVMGFTMGNSRLSLWIHDRSGVLGTANSIDIHEEPKKFIQIIAGFSLLPAAKLGYDPTMKLYLSPDVILPSYRLGSLEVEEAYHNGPYARQWIITMNNGGQYLTIRALSLARAGVMRGRGTLVWAVIPYGQGKGAQKVYVLKQSWRPKDVPSEGELYDAAEEAAEEAEESMSEYVGAIETCEGVLVEGVEDDTVSLIRKNLVHQSPVEATSGNKRPRPEDQEPFLHVACIGEEIDFFSVTGSPEPVARVRTRVLLSTYGWPLKCFSTLRELVQVLQDAVRGHQHLYSHGVLHRDISTGNILIEWPQPDGDKTDSDKGEGLSEPGSVDLLRLRGRLIDLDRAKRGKDKSLNHPVIEVKALDKDAKDAFKWSLIKQLQQRIPGLKDLDCQEDILSSLFLGKLRMEYGLDAIEHGLKFGHIVDGGICSFNTLFWKQNQIGYDYQFESHELQKGSRTGTPPFTSGEILSGSCYFDDPNGEDFQVYHNAVHDLESFFWVLVHICLTRSGPGGHRRAELTAEENAIGHSTLRAVVLYFFDADMGVLRDYKQQIFRKPGKFETLILANFHPYFYPLKGLVSEWFSLLRLAFKYRLFEWQNIHDRVILILEKALEQLGSAGGHIDDAATKKVLEVRQRDIERLTTAMRQTSHSTTTTVLQQEPGQSQDGSLWETSPPSQNRQQASHYYSRPPDSPTPRTKKLRH